ncbi:hypothetical protein B0H19DRAFT_1137472 [Mycena capillaripes]|nr:hypothetical protein B0H19DRAFT_1137472 [Mycena capillaripes]
MSAGQLRSAFPCFRKTALALALSVLRLSPTSWVHSAPTMQGFNPLPPHDSCLGPEFGYTLTLSDSHWPCSHRAAHPPYGYGILHDFLRLGILQFDYPKPLKYGARDIKIFFGT